MNPHNSLYTDLTCPNCHQTVDVEIELGFGEVSDYSYVLGDTYNWEPDKRPTGGNWDGAGIETCPECGKTYKVTVEIRNDVITRIIHRLDPAELESKHKSPQKPAKPGIQSGKITPGSQWELTPARKAALQRLVELGVEVYSLDGQDYTLMVPSDLPADHYIDIGYLIAQLGDEAFPQGYEGLTIKDKPSAVYEQRMEGHPPVFFVDGYPQGMKYRVQIKK
jgi:transcription elongation factor Elf1